MRVFKSFQSELYHTESLLKQIDQLEELMYDPSVKLDSLKKMIDHIPNIGNPESFFQQNKERIKYYETNSYHDYIELKDGMDREFYLYIIEESNRKNWQETVRNLILDDLNLLNKIALNGSIDDYYLFSIAIYTDVLKMSYVGNFVNTEFDIILIRDENNWAKKE